MKKYTWLLVATFFALTTLMIFWPFFTGLAPWRVDHPVHQALANYFMSQITAGHFPYGDFPYELGGYPFPTYGYELGYWLAAFFHGVFGMPQDFSYRAMVFVLYALAVVGPAAWITYRRGWLLGLWMGTALFSSLIFLQLTAFGMFHFVFAWSILFYLLAAESPRIYRTLPLLFLLSLAHPFALALGVVFALVQSFRSRPRQEFLGLGLGTMLICLPKISAAYYGMGWLKSSRAALSWSGFSKIFGEMYEHTLVPILTGGFLRSATWVDFSLEWTRTLPMLLLVVLSVRQVKSFQPLQKITLLLTLMLAGVSSVLWTQQTYLFPERMAFFALAALLAGLVNFDEAGTYVRSLKYLIVTMCLVSIALSIRMTGRNRAFNDHAATAVIEQSIRALCDRTDVKSDDRRLWLESLYDHEVWGPSSESNWLAHAHAWCKRSTLGTWSGDWPFPQWPIFSSRFQSVFGFPAATITPAAFKGMAEVWNVGWFVTHSRELKMKFLELKIPLVAEVQGFSLWKIAGPSRWLEVSDPAAKVEIIAQNNFEFTLESIAPRPYYLRVSRAYHPFYQASIGGVNQPIKSSGLFQPIVSIPAGHHRVKLGTR